MGPNRLRCNPLPPSNLSSYHVHYQQLVCIVIFPFFFFILLETNSQMSNIYRINVKWACLNSLGIAGAPATLPTTTLQVAEITQNSMRLSWNPLQGATGYVLRWGEVSGDKCASIFYVYCNVLLFTLWYMRINNNSKHLNCLDLSDIGRDTSVTLPASSSSYLVTGLRLGRQYRFTVQPTFPSGLGSASYVNERTGKIQTCALSFIWGRNSLFEFFSTSNISITQFT